MRLRRMVFGRPRRGRRSRSGSGGPLNWVILPLVLLFVLASYVGWPVAIGVAVVVAALVVWVLIRKYTLSTPKAKDLYLELQNVRAMSGPQFKVFVKRLLTALGYSARVLGGSGDQGVDVIASMNGSKVAIQCKNYNKPVGNKPVQEVYAGSKHHRCDQAWVVAPAGYTKGAHELAQSVGVSLLDARAIRAWIRQVDQNERNQASSEPRVVDLDEIDRRERETVQ